MNLTSCVQQFAKRALIKHKIGLAVNESELAPVSLYLPSRPRITLGKYLKLTDFTNEQRLAFALAGVSESYRFPLFGDHFSFDDALELIGPHIEFQKQHVQSWNDFFDIELIIDITEASLSTTDHAELNDLICAAIVFNEQNPVDAAGAAASWIIEKQIARELPELLESDTATVPIKKIERFWWSPTKKFKSRINANSDQKISLKEIKEFIQSKATEYSELLSKKISFFPSSTVAQFWLEPFSMMDENRTGVIGKRKFETWRKTNSRMNEIDFNAIDTNYDDLVSRAEFIQYRLQNRNNN